MSRIKRDCENLGVARVDLGPVEMGEGGWTWENAIRNAFEGVDAAYRHREHVVKAAHDAGLSYRTIADVAGVAFTTIGKICGGTRKHKAAQAELLKSSASGVEQDNPGDPHE